MTGHCPHGTALCVLQHAVYLRFLCTWVRFALLMCASWAAYIHGQSRCLPAPPPSSRPHHQRLRPAAGPILAAAQRHCQGAPYHRAGTLPKPAGHERAVPGRRRLRLLSVAGAADVPAARDGHFLFSCEAVCTGGGARAPPPGPRSGGGLSNVYLRAGAGARGAGPVKAFVQGASLGVPVCAGGISVCLCGCTGLLHSSRRPLYSPSPPPSPPPSLPPPPPRLLSETTAGGGQRGPAARVSVG
jgi:hypothetical protein